MSSLLICKELHEKENNTHCLGSASSDICGSEDTDSAAEASNTPEVCHDASALPEP